jgi:outer membrane receptor for ferrienterochelin and colicins
MSVSSWSGAEEKDYLSMDIEELTEISLSPTSKSRSPYEAPASVTVITAEQIRRFGYRTFSEALRSVVGMYVYTDGSSDYLATRGFGSPSNFAQRILLLIDGHNVSDPLFNYVRVGEEVPIDILEVERIEVIKGPVSAAWGTGALLGVVNIVTESGRNIGGGKLIGEVGSTDRKKAGLLLGNITDYGLEYSAGVTGVEVDGRSSIYYPEFDTPSTNSGISENLDARTIRTAYAKARYQDFLFTVHYGQSARKDPSARYLTKFNSPDNHINTETLHLDLRYERVPEKGSQTWWFARAYYDSWMRKVRFEDLFPFVDRITRLDSDAQAIGAEANVSSVIGPVHVLGGVEATHALELDSKIENIAPARETVFDDGADLTVVSAYGEAGFMLTPTIQILATARFDHYSSLGGQWSPRLGATWHATPSTDLKFVMSNAYRAPSINELYGIRGDGFKKNEDLNVETLESFEAIVEHRFSPYLTGTVSIFHHTLEDLITANVTPQGLTATNIGKAVSMGVEVSFEGHLEGDVLLRGGASVLEATDKDLDRDLPNSPQLLATGGVSYPLVDRWLYLSPEIHYLAERANLRDESIGTSFIANLILFTRELLPRSTLSFGVYNLTDEQNYSPGTAFHRQQRLPEMGRTYGAQFSWRF